LGNGVITSVGSATSIGGREKEVGTGGRPRTKGSAGVV